MVTKMKISVSEYIPDVSEMIDGVLYVSFKYSTASHLCACGCKELVVTPLKDEAWKLSFRKEVSLTPSIGNWSFKCRSHYFISNGYIEWCEKFSKKYVKKTRRKRKKKKFLWF